MELITAKVEDFQRVYDLYTACKNRPLSHWRDEYPDAQNVREDIAQGALYLLVENDTLMGAVSAGQIEETGTLVKWRESARPCEISRVCVSPAFQGKGLSGQLLSLLLPKLEEKGYTAARLLVAQDVLPAKRAYLRAGFTVAGSVYVADWDHCWYDCMERAL